MRLGNILRATGQHLGLGAALLSMAVNLVVPPPMAAETKKAKAAITPIQHVIVIIGENRSFDHVYATYQPKSGQKVWNLLSEGIVNKNGSPGPNFYKAEQH